MMTDAAPKGHPLRRINDWKITIKFPALPCLKRGPEAGNHHNQFNPYREIGSVEILDG